MKRQWEFPIQNACSRSDGRGRVCFQARVAVVAAALILLATPTWAAVATDVPVRGSPGGCAVPWEQPKSDGREPYSVDPTCHKEAILRLVESSADIREVFRSIERLGGVLVLWKDARGRPPAWCKSLLRDLVDMQNVEVVDYLEAYAQPRFVYATSSREQNAPADTRYEALDPLYRTKWQQDRYVTFRWRKSNIVTVYMRNLSSWDQCVSNSCTPPYPAVVVADTVSPQGCDMGFVASLPRRSPRSIVSVRPPGRP